MAGQARNNHGSLKCEAALQMKGRRSHLNSNSDSGGLQPLRNARCGASTLTDASPTVAMCSQPVLFHQTRCHSCTLHVAINPWRHIDSIDSFKSSPPPPPLPPAFQLRGLWHHNAPTPILSFIMPDFKPGQIVQLSDGRKATVRFAGQTNFQVGEWIGVELEDKTGKNDGSVQGVRYFDCPAGYGMFVKPMMATIIAQAPSTKPVGRKPARPSSFHPASVKAAPSGDVALAKRRSLNAPSPSPVPKSRPTSLVRVRIGAPIPTVDLANSHGVVSRKISNKAAQRRIQCLCFSNRHAVKCTSSISICGWSRQSKNIR